MLLVSKDMEHLLEMVQLVSAQIFFTLIFQYFNKTVKLCWKYCFKKTRITTTQDPSKIADIKTLTSYVNVPQSWVYHNIGKLIVVMLFICIRLTLCLIYLSVTPLILSFQFLQGVYPQTMKFTRTIIYQLIILQR